jgi:hypothetical protein
MTRTTIARWTCNTCGDLQETDTSKQPEGWVGYGFTEPGIPAGEHNVLGHLCRPCARTVRDAVSGSAA